MAKALGSQWLDLDRKAAVNKGKILHGWIDGEAPAGSRPSRSCTLKFQDIPLALKQNMRLDLADLPSTSLGDVIIRSGEMLGLMEKTRQYYQVDFRPSERVQGVWKGIVTHGAIFIQNMARDSTVSSPYTSCILQAVYENFHPIQSLGHIFMIGVVNQRTLRVLPEMSRTSDQTWLADSEEYFALLGSPLGKIVAHFVLGAPKTVAFRISAISVIEVDSLRFDIEEVSPTQVQPNVTTTRLPLRLKGSQGFGHCKTI